MGLNWSMEVFLSFFSGILLCVAFLTLIPYFVKKKERFALWFSLANLCILLKAIIGGFSILFLSFGSFPFSFFPLYFAGYFLLFGIDALTRDTIDPIKTSIWTGLIVILSLLGFQPGAIAIIIFPNGDQGILMQDWFQNLMGISMLFIIAVLTYYSVRIYHETQASKQYAITFLLAALMLVVAGILVALGIILYVPGVHMVIIAMGMILISFIFRRQPQIAHILHFRVYRLSVIDTNGGLPLFTFDWKQGTSLVNQQLFSGMLQGVGIILDSALNQGEIHEIRLTQGVLILNRSNDYPVVCALVATTNTLTLRRALDGFAHDFYTQFAPNLRFSKIVEQDDSARQLVKKWFEFVPAL